jgi:hypothetical protein
MNYWQSKISTDRKRLVIENIANQTGLSPHAIEKDWWVTMVLKALFKSSCAEYLEFKGGTSLSKGWNLIGRFSEDIDVAISREFFGLSGDLGKNQRDKLRRKSSKYIQDSLAEELYDNMKNDGISGYSVDIVPTESSDKDPRVLLVRYESLFSKSKYLPNWVKVEISCRSLHYPFVPINMRSIIADHYPNENFSDCYFSVNTVSPKRTFLEKAFLIHEALQKGRTKSERMTRHLYDLHKLMDTAFAREALSDAELYKTIVKHRSVMTREKGVDYSTLRPSQINFVPTGEIAALWRDDYKNMQEVFIHEEALGFDALLERIMELCKRFNSIEMDEIFFDSL